MDIYVSSRDYNKAFDRVKHDKLMEILKSKNLDKRNITLIANLYYKQYLVRIGQHVSEEIKIRGVRKGCILLLLVFNACSE